MEYLDVSDFFLSLLTFFTFSIFLFATLHCFQVVIGAYGSPQIDLYDSLMNNEKKNYSKHFIREEFNISNICP